ncbi:WHG domain-containing protein [Rossellomorea marisflavi]|uniref:TetR/AcrR family transcriptional regulator n=1 Tax=Rossellomorea marisflavi TaxID=189381 RepID=UPI0035121B51
MSPRIGMDLDIIVKAAIELADREGMSEVTLATLAKSLDVRPPSLYNHVKGGLPALKIEMAKLGYSQLNRRLTDASVGRSMDAAVLAFGMAYVQFVRDHPGLYEAMLMVAIGADEELQDIQDQSIRIITQVMEGYDLGEHGTLHAVRGLRSILHGFASLEQHGEFGLPLEKDKSLTKSINAFLAGIHWFKDSNE